MSGVVFRNIDPPPHRPLVGGGHTSWVERGWGVNSSEDARHCSVLYKQYVSTLRSNILRKLYETKYDAQSKLYFGSQITYVHNVKFLTYLFSPLWSTFECHGVSNIGYFLDDSKRCTKQSHFFTCNSPMYFTPRISIIFTNLYVPLTPTQIYLIISRNTQSSEKILAWPILLQIAAQCTYKVAIPALISPNLRPKGIESSIAHRIKEWSAFQ